MMAELLNKHHRRQPPKGNDLLRFLVKKMQSRINDEIDAGRLDPKALRAFASALLLGK